MLMKYIIWHISCLFFSDNVKAVSMSGKMKSSKRQAAELHFDFPVESLGKLNSVVF